MDIWSNFTRSVPEYAVEAYSTLDPWFYPILLLGIIGYIYTSMHSATAAIVAILITFGLFATSTSIFVDTSEMSILLYLISIVGLAFLVTTLLTQRRSN